MASTIARAPTDRLEARISASILAASSGFARSFSSFSLMLSILRVVILTYLIENSLCGSNAQNHTHAVEDVSRTTVYGNTGTTIGTCA